MPITGSASYISTCQSFLTHWNDVNAALPPGSPLTLAGSLVGQTTPLTLATFTGLFDSLKTQRNTVTESLVEVEFARGAVLTLKLEAAARIGQFIGVVRGNLLGTKYERSLPPQPDVYSTQDDLQSAAIRVRKLWEKLNADAATGMTLPLLLEGGFPLADYGTEVVDQIPTVFFALETANSTVRLEREERNDLQDKIYPILKAYRQVQPTKFPDGNALTDSLPDLSPKPGSTPKPVTLTGLWEAASSQAKLTWTASTDSALATYELRAVPGPVYTTDDEVTVASFSPTDPKEYLTAQFFGTPGTVVSYKIYVQLTTGNEAGSDPVSVERPM